jgi:hypothetical protein
MGKMVGKQFFSAGLAASHCHSGASQEVLKGVLEKDKYLCFVPPRS